MKEIKAFLTDLDGTLCSTLEANVAAYKAAFSDVAIPFDELLYTTNFGLDFTAMMNVLIPHKRAYWDKIAKRKQYHYTQLSHLIKPNEALIKILENAKLNGIKIGLASTAKRANGETALQALGCINLFDATIFAEDVKNKKPNPECYIALAHRLEVDPVEAIVFEDTDIGIEAAIKAGAKALKVSI